MTKSTYPQSLPVSAKIADLIRLSQQIIHELEEIKKAIAKRRKKNRA